MTINTLREWKPIAAVLAIALLFSSIGFAPAATADHGDVHITAAPQGSVVLDGNGGATLQTFSPDLDLDTSTAAELTASTTADVTAYYGVRIQSATTTGDVFWRITVSHATDALATGDVMITEKGYFDATGGTVADSAYTATEVGGDLVLEGNAGWETMAGDDFTNVDEIIFDLNAPLGVYTITRVLIDNSTTTEAEISAPFSFTVDLAAEVVADTTAPVFGTTTDVMATATTSAGVIVNFTVEATDDTDPDVNVTCDPASGTLFAVGTTTVDCTAMDNASNTATTTFDVIVDLDEEATTTPNTILITHPIFASGLYCATSTPVLLEGSTNASSTITIVGGLNNATTTSNGSGAWSNVINLASNATSSVLVTVYDSGGNAVATTTLNFAFDTTAPTITLNGDANVSVSRGGTFTDAGFTVSDALDANVATSTSGTVDMNTNGTYTITYTATDCAGNTSTATRTVTVSGGSSGGGSGSASGRRNAIPGLTNAFNQSGNPVVGYVLAGIVEGPAIPNTGSVMGLAIGHFLRDLRRGDRGQDVAELQARLFSTGLFKGPITGFFGPLTQEAVRDLQRGLSLPVTGIFDLNTRTVINNS